MEVFDFSKMPIEDIYKLIGQSIVSAIPEAWKRAAAYAEIEEDDNGLTYGTYTPAIKPQEERYFEPADELYFLFDELRRRFRQPGQAPWVKARFTLYPDGHFDLDFTYLP